MGRDMSPAEWTKAIDKAVKDAPDFFDHLTVTIGQYAAGIAKKICRDEHISRSRNNSSGQYAEAFHSGTKAIRQGNYYKIDVYNNLDYAKHLEYGFRSHWVPGYWAGSSFIYQKGFPGGMYVGPKDGFVPGHFVLTRACRETKEDADVFVPELCVKFLKDHGITE
jgi:hypothetical protein